MYRGMTFDNKYAFQITGSRAGGHNVDMIKLEGQLCRIRLSVEHSGSKIKGKK